VGRKKPRTPQGPVPRAAVKASSTVARGAGAKRISLTSAPIREERLTWQFGRFDPHGPFDKHIDGDGAASLLGLLGQIEGRTHAELFDTPGYRQTVGAAKLIPKDSLESKAVARLEHLELDDLDGLWEIRQSRTARVWVVRNRYLVHVLWWDPDHQVCP